MIVRCICCFQPIAGNACARNFILFSLRFLLVCSSFVHSVCYSKDIRAALASGQTVVCDRYAFSGVVFSAAKGLPLEWCQACDGGLPAPDLVIQLDMPVEAAASRAAYGDERYEKIAFQKRVQGLYARLREEMPVEQQHTWAVINADADRDAVSEEIRRVVGETLLRVTANPEIRLLWNWRVESDVDRAASAASSEWDKEPSST